MFVFGCIEPRYQKDKHQPSCVDDAVSCLLNLVDNVCLTSGASHYLFIVCKSTSYWNDWHDEEYYLHIKRGLAWSSHWETASPWSDTNVNIMNLILLKYLVPMRTTFFNTHSVLCISHDFDDQQWLFPYATLHSWSLFWFCEVWTGFLYMVWLNLDFKGLRIWPVLWKRSFVKYERVDKENIFRHTN